jgi:proline iminopeptidase
MSHGSSVAKENDWKYPEPDEVVDQGWLEVPGSHHRIYWHEYGTPEGTPVMFLHGGPGGGTKPKQARFFNPRRYRIILFDQRGCGKSTPNAGSDDPRLAQQALTANTVDDLVSDINLLRQHLNIAGKMHVFGGSWGSTLAMAYAIRHPENIGSLILRGIFLLRKKDLDYLYQGNAANYHQDPFDTTLSGAYIFYPEEWKRFVELIDVRERGDMVKAYGKIFSQPKDAAELDRACAVWSRWEGSSSNLIAEEDLSGHEDPGFARTFARIENHYFVEGGFPKAATERGYLLENAGKFAHLDIHIVQGEFDQVCPRCQADELVAALKAANARRVEYVVTTAGHSQYDKETMKALTRIMDGVSSPVGKKKS